MKLEQNTKPEEIDILRNPNNETIIFRYILASSFCKNKKVLDCATGYGHGAGILKSLGATSVTAFDIDQDALDYVNAQWNQIINVEKKNVLVKDKKHTSEFDTVVSIETFEHLPPEKLKIYLANLKHWCKPGGQIFITTPRRKLEEWKYTGGAHQYEYSLKEFNREITEAFNESMIEYVGIQEVRMGDFRQLVSILNQDVTKSDIMCAIIQVKK